MSPARLLKVSPETCRMAGGSPEGDLCAVEDPEGTVEALQRQCICDRASLQGLARQMVRARELQMGEVARSLREHMDLVGRRLKDVGGAARELEQALGADAAAEEYLDRVRRKVREL